MANEKDKKESGPIYPSRFGSHTTMVDKAKTALLVPNDDMSRTPAENALRAKHIANGLLVVCADEYGDYETLKERLDSGCADPNRYVTKRLNKLFNLQSESKKEEK